MTLNARTLAIGDGWQASDVRCQAGPMDSAFEEQHERVSVAIVLEGTFGYRSSRGKAVLAPGAILLGNPGDCFECGHQHSVGDRCLSFHFTPAFYEMIAADVARVTRLHFNRAALPPHGAGADLLLNADLVCEEPGIAEEFACELAARVATALLDERPTVSSTGSKTRRIQEVVHWIEQEAHEPQTLADFARMACMSPFHFLREFKRVVGMTPHQFVISIRMRRAADHLRRQGGSVLQAAVEAGFSDLSEFNRRFRRVLGETPGEYRARIGIRGNKSNICR